jgi:D-glycerate 3-kinase
MDDTDRPTASSLVAAYIRSLVPDDGVTDLKAPPLFVALQGPQGIGKTTLTKALQSELASPPRPLRIVILGLDDFYLPHSGLLAKAQEYPQNKLLQGRGQPGTHDLPLLCGVLRELEQCNGHDKAKVVLPLFDKSLNDGQGDRSKESIEIDGRVDVVILEGWCVGFYPLTEDNLQSKFQSLVSETTEQLDADETLAREIVRRYTLEDIRAVNTYLRGYAEKIYPFFSGFVQLAPPSSKRYTAIYKWRLQQEHDMKSANGGRGMSDSQVKEFIDRYIPGYVFFRFGVEKGWLDFPSDKEGARGAPPWKSRGLRIILDEQRAVVGTSQIN